MAEDTGEFDQFVKDEVAKAVAGNAAAAQGQDGPQPAPNIAFSVKGQDYNYNTAKELEEAVNYTVDTYQGQIKDLEDKLAAQNDSPAAAEPVDDSPKFDNAEYIRRMDEDPVAAANYVDTFRYGVENPVELVKQAANQSQTNQRVLDVNQFRGQHPEFQASPQGAKVLQDIIQEKGWTFNFSNLEASLAVAQQRGQLPTANQYQTYVQQQQTQVPDQSLGAPQAAPPYNPQTPWLNAPSAPPPRAGQPGGLGFQGEDPAEELSIDQLETILRRAGQDV